MTKQQRELIDSLTEYPLGTAIFAIHLIPDGKYTGFWGENGFKKMILIGEDQDANLYLINKTVQTDLISLMNCEGIRAIDCPEYTGGIRICFFKPIVITKLLSTIHPLDADLLEMLDDLDFGEDTEDDDEPVGKA